MIDTENYQPARQNMKFVTRTLRSLATKLHISISINSHPDNIYVSPLPTLPLTGIQMSITLNIYLLYWYFQQHPCFNIKNI
jgi:hypothetical protein